MIILFWCLTIVLSLIAIAILIPWLKVSASSVWLYSIVLLCSYSFYGLYYRLSPSQHLKHYYSLEEKQNRDKMQAMRPLMIELKKQEFRLKFYLEENPKDLIAQSHLLELLSIQALQVGDKLLAKQFLLKAIDLLSDENSHSNIKASEQLKQTYFKRKKHIQELLQAIF